VSGGYKAAFGQSDSAQDDEALAALKALQTKLEEITNG